MTSSLMDRGVTPAMHGATDRILFVVPEAPWAPAVVAGLSAHTRVCAHERAQAPHLQTKETRLYFTTGLRTELAALPTIGAAIETMEFPPSTWNFLPWGAGKLDEVSRTLLILLEM